VNKNGDALAFRQITALIQKLIESYVPKKSHFKYLLNIIVSFFFLGKNNYFFDFMHASVDGWLKTTEIG
jgi:hypothetical protein